jgi:hypothetical protein
MGALSRGLTYVSEVPADTTETVELVGKARLTIFVMPRKPRPRVGRMVAMGRTADIKAVTAQRTRSGGSTIRLRQNFELGLIGTA